MYPASQGKQYDILFAYIVIVLVNVWKSYLEIELIFLLQVFIYIRN